MGEILEAIQAVTQNVDSRFKTLQGQFGELQKELSTLKTEMVTRVQFESLESRVYKLETNAMSSENPDVKFPQSQLDRLDPSRFCVSIIGFKGEGVTERTQLIDTFLKEKLSSFGDLLRIEHVYKGKFHERKLATVSLVEFPSKVDRDTALQQIKNPHAVLTEQGNNLRFDYAKTKKQQLVEQRPSCLESNDS